MIRVVQGTPHFLSMSFFCVYPMGRRFCSFLQTTDIIMTKCVWPPCSGQTGSNSRLKKKLLFGLGISTCNIYKRRGSAIHSFLVLLNSLHVSNDHPPPPRPVSAGLLYRSDLVVSVPHGSLVRFVWTLLFSHEWRPLSGPGLGSLATSPADSLRAVRSDFMVSGVRSS